MRIRSTPLSKIHPSSMKGPGDFDEPDYEEYDKPEEDYGPEPDEYDEEERCRPGRRSRENWEFGGIDW